MTRAAVLEQVDGYGVSLLCLTGGEPMLQSDEAVALMRQLVQRNYTVLLETNGTIPLDPVPSEVIKVMDVKTPDGLGMKLDDPRWLKEHFHYPNLQLLGAADQVKFVITSRFDYEWSRDFVREHRLLERCGEVLFSPSWGEVDPKDLVVWILEDRLPVRLNLQVHKYVWGADATGV